MQKKQPNKPLSAINFLLTLGISGSALWLLYLASHGGAGQIIIAAVAFSIILQPNYVLLHEGVHDNHQQNPLLNRLMSFINGALFPISATFYRLTHGFHHDNNRNEHECFEYYDPQQPRANQIFRHLQWYSILFGTYWIFILLTNLIAASLPWLLKLWPFNAYLTTNKMFNRFNTRVLQWISIETGLIILLWVLLWYLLDLKLIPSLILYAAFAFNWSTRQYIAHAFSPIDRDSGAYNLKLGKWAQLFLLNSNYHLVHHQHPELPWHLLPAYAEHPPLVDYWRQYRQLWSAPRVFPASHPDNRAA